MKIKYPYDILMIGVSSSWFLGFLFFLFQSLTNREYIPAVFYLAVLIGTILILVYKSQLDQSEDQSKSEGVEQYFLIASLMTVCIALVVFLITFSQYWLAKELRYFSLVFGLPSLGAILYWNRYKSRKTIN
jgi:hypothetical protein